MMKRAPLLIAAIALGAAAAQAQTPVSGGGRLEMIGEAPAACVISGAATSNAVNATVDNSGSSGSRVRITEMVDRTNAQAKAVTVDLTLPVTCNAPHRVVLRSGNGGLLRAGASAQRTQNGFAEFVAYQLDANWAGQQVSSRSDGAGGLVIQSPAGQAGQVAVSINVPPGGTPLVAGAYSDEIVIEFQVAS